jgi:hypothetical protein
VRVLLRLFRRLSLEKLMVGLCHVRRFYLSIGWGALSPHLYIAEPNRLGNRLFLANVTMPRRPQAAPRKSLWRPNRRTQNTGDIVDAEGNLRVPADYRTAYQFGQRGGGSRPRPGFEGDPCRLRVAGHDRRLSQRWTVLGWLRASERGL